MTTRNEGSSLEPRPSSWTKNVTFNEHEVVCKWNAYFLISYQKDVLERRRHLQAVFYLHLEHSDIHKKSHIKRNISELHPHILQRWTGIWIRFLPFCYIYLRCMLSKIIEIKNVLDKYTQLYVYVYYCLLLLSIVSTPIFIIIVFI